MLFFVTAGMKGRWRQAQFTVRATLPSTIVLHPCVQLCSRSRKSDGTDSVFDNVRSCLLAWLNFERQINLSQVCTCMGRRIGPQARDEATGSSASSRRMTWSPSAFRPSPFPSPSPSPPSASCPTMFLLPARPSWPSKFSIGFTTSESSSSLRARLPVLPRRSRNVTDYRCSTQPQLEDARANP